MIDPRRVRNYRGRGSGAGEKIMTSKRSASVRCVTTGILCLAIVVLGVDVASAERPASCADEPTKFARVDITIDGDQIKVEPFSQTIYLDREPSQICWVVNNLGEQRTMHIERKEAAKSVFSEKLIVDPNRFVESGIPELELEPGESYTWEYNPGLTETGNTERLLFRDPEVIIVKGKGGR